MQSVKGQSLKRRKTGPFSLHLLKGEAALFRLRRVTLPPLHRTACTGWRSHQPRGAACVLRFRSGDDRHSVGRAPNPK
ncbi:hypothetical protein E2C01_076399 [Portunus trituberculatus]|uniref:Uncharacterized protein n=1 Tax=Portunus trituberculatus TaxID=210409 RepID=A0A5B7IIG0_PORTR|nr:hypothetical protein [Portunus trituberculatus]